METTSVDIPYLIFLTVLGIYMLLLVFMLVWLYFDAEHRGVNGYVVVALAVFTGTILGTLGWLILRPQKQVKAIPVGS